MSVNVNERGRIERSNLRKSAILGLSIVRVGCLFVLDGDGTASIVVVVATAADGSQVR